MDHYSSFNNPTAYTAVTMGVARCLYNLYCVGGDVT